MGFLILFIAGLIIGTLGSLVGLGGGVFLVPALLFFGSYGIGILSGVTPQIAVGTSLFITIFTGLSSTLSYIKVNRVDYKSALLFLLGSGPGGLLGAWINQFMNFQSFSIYFGSFIIIISLLLTFQANIKPNQWKYKRITRVFIDSSGRKYTYSYSALLGVILAFFVGLCSGLFGIGGGSIMVPIMIMLFRFPPHIAIATSMFMIFLSSIVSSFAHVYLGNINWLFALILLPGAWFGGKLGAWLNQKLKGNTLIVLLRFILVIIGIRLIYQGM